MSQGEEAPQDSPAVANKIVFVTGLSGSGKSSVVHALEDIGFFCIDNLPVPLLSKVLELAATQADDRALQRLAFVVDTRERNFLHQAADAIDTLRAEGNNVEVVFLEAEDDELVRRYSETRRRHPMSDDGTVRDGIERERALLEKLRQGADWLLDTTHETVHTLKAKTLERFGDAQSAGLAITVLSFGFKYGLPPECDLVFDVRFIPNPYFVEGLREQTGLDIPVRDYVLGAPESGGFLRLVRQIGDFMLPLYQREGKAYLTIGIGCTGGRHRSVAIAEEVRTRLKGRGWDVGVKHRDVER